MTPATSKLEMAVPSEENIAMEFIAPHAAIADWFTGTPKKGQTLGMKIVEVVPHSANPELTVVRMQFVPINVD